ncbi:MAG: alpha-E domain-containing protein [Acidimicrobiia bacterium]|nr:alpha-E domain-containing protein [Acidimicrobiia bacterium]
MFWMGRYIERAADVTRMLDVAYHAQLERSPELADQVWRDLLRVLYLEERYRELFDDEMTTANMNQLVVFDKEAPSSVWTSVSEARTNVMNLRDAVPSELLEAVNRLYTRLASGSMVKFVDNPHELYDTLSGHCRGIAGAITETMSREDQYRFLALGRLLERAEMTCRMIDVNRSSDDVATWMSVLRSVSGFHGFIRSQGPLAPARDVVAYMLQEPSFPFGVLYCLERCRALLDAVAGAGTWTSPRALGRVKAELEYAEVPEVASPALGELLESLEKGIRAVSTALRKDLYQFGGDPSVYSFEAI